MLLKDLFEFLPKSKHNAATGSDIGDYPFLTSSNTINKYSEFHEYKGEHLVIGDGGVGNCKYVNYEFSASDHNYILKPKENTNCKAVYYFLLKDDYKILNEGFKGVGIKNVAKSYLQNIDFRYNAKYSLEQIVESLDRINNYIDKGNYHINLLDELVKSRFIEMFGDPVKNEKKFKTMHLSKVCPFNTYKDNVEEFDGKVWLLNLDMVESNTGNIIDKLYVDEKKVGNSTIKFDNNCVLYSKLRPYLNKVVIPDSSGYATSELIYLEINDKIINKYYLAELLRSESFVKYINSKTAGAKMPRVSMNHFRDFELMIPNIEEQTQFAQVIKQIDKSKFNVQKRIDFYKELLEKKMDEYFND